MSKKLIKKEVPQIININKNVEIHILKADYLPELVENLAMAVDRVFRSIALDDDNLRMCCASKFLENFYRASTGDIEVFKTDVTDITDLDDEDVDYPEELFDEEETIDENLEELEQ